MAEGFSAPPPDEIQPEPPRREIFANTPHPGGRGIFETIRFKMMQNRERAASREEDDDDDEKKKKGSRFGRLLKRIFVGIVDKEEIPDDGKQPERSGIFFGVGEVTDPEPSDSAVETALPAEKTVEIEEQAVEDTAPADTAEAGPILTTAVAPETTASIESEPAPDETDSPTPEQAAEVFDTERVHTVETEPDRVPEGVLLYGAYDRHRIRKLENRESELERTVKRLDKKSDERKKAAPAVVYERPKAPTPEARQPAVKAPEKFVPKIENIKTPERKQTIDSETTPEQRRTAVEKAVEKHSRELSGEKKKEIIERILIAPEFKGALNTEIQKEITYEMSHEAKDMDAQSQTTWAALQAAADATAKANAQALANASSQIPTAVSGDALKQAAAAQKALEDKQGLYKKAAFSGFLTAVVIVAVLLIILVIQHN